MPVWRGRISPEGISMAGIEAGVSVATIAGPSIHAGSSFAAPTMGEMHAGGSNLVPLGDIPSAPHGEMAPNVSLLDGLAPYDFAMDTDMMGVGGRATPFDVPALQNAPITNIFTQAAEVAAKAWANPISQQTPVQDLTNTYDVVTEAVQVAHAAENAFIKDQAQQIALYTALFSIPVAAPEAVKEVTTPVPTVRSVPGIVVAPQVARTETHVEQSAEAVSRDVIVGTPSPEKVGQEADAKLAGKVEELARSLGLEQLANEVVGINISATQQEMVVVGSQPENEVIVEEVLEEAATQNSKQRSIRASSYVAVREEIANKQILPDGQGEQEAVDGQVSKESITDVRRDEAKKPEGVLVDEGPMKAAETNKRRRGIATEVVEEAKETLDTEGKILGAVLAREFRERANAQALSPILNGQGPDGSVDYIVAPLEGQIFNDTDTLSTVLQRGVSAYTAVAIGNRKDASPDDVARVYGGSRRGIVVAA